MVATLSIGAHFVGHFRYQLEAQLGNGVVYKKLCIAIFSYAFYVNLVYGNLLLLIYYIHCKYFIIVKSVMHASYYNYIALPHECLIVSTPQIKVIAWEMDIWWILDNRICTVYRVFLLVDILLCLNILCGTLLISVYLIKTDLS